MDSSLVMEGATTRDQFDLSYLETSQGRVTGNQAGRERGIRGGSNRQTPDSVPGILMDRVSISSSARESYKSRYASRLNARSTVTITETGQTVSREQAHAVEKLIGGVIDSQLYLGNTGRSDTDQTRPAGPAEPGQWQMRVSRTRVHFEQEAMAFNASGSVTTDDGRVIDFSLDMALERAFAHEQTQTDTIDIWQEEVALTDPLVINLSGSAPELTDMTFAFDLDSDGDEEQISFLSRGSGFLALDKNRDNTINDGSELFGPNTGNGFDELAQYDEDANGWIDEADAVFEQLSVWTRDEAGNDVLMSLKDAGIGAISLSSAATSFDMTSQADGMENQLKGRVRQGGVFLFENGGVGSIQQIDLAARDTGAPSLEAPLEMMPQAPLQESLAIHSDIMAANHERMLNARLEQAELFEQEPEPANPFKALLEMIEELRDELEASLKKHRPGSVKPDQGLSGFLNQEMLFSLPMAQFSYRI